MVSRLLSGMPVTLTLTSLFDAPVIAAEAKPTGPKASLAAAVPVVLMVLSNWKTMTWPLAMVRDSTVTAAPKACVASMVKSRGPATPCIFRDLTPVRASALASIALKAVSPNAMQAMDRVIYKVEALFEEVVC